MAVASAESGADVDVDVGAGLMGAEVGTVRENGRWHLTGLQMFLVVLTVVAALFLTAMALGSSSRLLLLVAATLLVGTGLAVFLLGLRHNGRRGAQGTGYVISVHRPPTDKIQSRCEMRMRVNLPGRLAVDMKVRDPAVPVSRWPVVGQTLPIEVAPNNPRHIRVRWDLVEMGYIRIPDTTPQRPTLPRQVSPALPPDLTPDYSPTPAYSPTALSPMVHVFTDYADGAFGDPIGNGTDPVIDDDYNPLPLRRSAPAAPVPSGVPDPYAELDVPENGGNFDASHSSVDDWVSDPEPESGRLDSDDALSPDAEPTVRSIPSPRPAEEPTIRFSGSPRPDGDTPAIGGMLIVADLDRSLRFYSAVLGFTIVYAASGNAVVEYGSGRILLQHMADFSPIDRRVGHLHIEVPDLDLAFTDLLAKGVEFSHRPRMVSRGDDMELWKATFRDPDGHGIALTQWRARDPS